MPNKLFRYDFEEQDGKMVRVRRDEIYGWMGIYTETGEVETSDFRQFNDELDQLVDGWEWKRFTLLPSPVEDPALKDLEIRQLHAELTALRDCNGQALAALQKMQWEQDRDCPYPALSCVGCGAAQEYEGQPGHDHEGCPLQEAITQLKALQPQRPVESNPNLSTYLVCYAVPNVGTSTSMQGYCFARMRLTVAELDALRDELLEKKVQDPSTGQLVELPATAKLIWRSITKLDDEPTRP